MGNDKDMLKFLELLPQPAFCVSGGVIADVNQAARQLLIQPDQPVAALLGEDAGEYGAFREGALFLTLRLEGRTATAAVTRMDGCDVFTVEDSREQPELQALALAAMQLRRPISDLTALLHRDPGKEQGELDQRMHQIHRLICNMSDAARYCATEAPRMVYVDVCAAISEQLAKIQALTADSRIHVEWTCPQEQILTMIEPEMLERALYNMISNALKVSRAGDRVHVRLSRKGERLYLSVRDQGPGIPEQALGSVFTRFRRQPGLEASQDGIGLGMPLICAAASAHSGTVLIHCPKDGGTQITLSLTIRHSDGTRLRSPALRIDYAGEKDHALLELSDALPAQAYHDT